MSIRYRLMMKPFRIFRETTRLGAEHRRPGAVYVRRAGAARHASYLRQVQLSRIQLRLFHCRHLPQQVRIFHHQTFILPNPFTTSPRL